MPRPSRLEPDVRLSPHTAPDVLSLRFCSRGCGHGRTHVKLQDCPVSHSDGFHLHGAD